MYANGRRQIPAPGSLLFFDFGGTLDADGLSWNHRFHAAYQQTGGSLSRDHFDSMFTEAEINLDRIQGIRSLGFRQTVEGLALMLGQMLPDATGTDLARVAKKVADDAMRVARRNRKLLARLARRYRLAIISNFHGNLVNCLDDLGLLPFFECVIDSGVVGIRKGDRRIFELALAKLGAHASNCWMIGDDADLDLLPASTLGMHTCGIGPEVSPARGYQPTLVVRGLEDLTRRWT